MSEKVIKTGLAGRAGLFGGVEVEVPSWNEFWHETQRLWGALDHLFLEKPEHGPEDPPYENRIHDFRNQVLSMHAEINGPRPNGGWTIRQCIENHGRRLDGLNDRLGKLPDALRETVREAVRTELEPLLGPAVANIRAILEDNRKLREELDSLRAEIDELKQNR